MGRVGEVMHIISNFPGYFCKCEFLIISVREQPRIRNLDFMEFNVHNKLPFCNVHELCGKFQIQMLLPFTADLLNITKWKFVVQF